MRAREFLFEYDRKKTAQMISGSEKAEKALITDRGDVGPLDKTRNDLINLSLGRPKNSAAKPAFSPPSDYRENTGPLIKDPAVRERFLEDLLRVIETKDPTPNKQYTPWLARMYVNGGVKLEDLNRNNLLGMYDLGKKRRIILPVHKDINSFKSYSSFENTMMTSYNLDEFTLDNKAEEQGTASKVFENDNVLVVVPHDEAASCRYGKGTRWCTAASRGSNMFDHYNSTGKLYIVIPKKPAHEGEKYQLHVPSGQYMNENDRDINLPEFFTNRFPELREFFLKNEPDLKDTIMMCTDEELKSYIDQIADIAEEHLWEVLSEWEQNDDYYYRDMQERYADEDGDIDWDKVHQNGDEYSKWNDDARRFINDMGKAIRPTPRAIRWLMDSESLGDLYELDLKHLPDIVAFNVRDEFPLGVPDGEMPEFIKRNIDMRKEGGEWVAHKLSKKFTRW